MQRAVPKTHDKAMENLDQKLEAKQEAIKKAEKELKHAKKVAANTLLSNAKIFVLSISISLSLSIQAAKNGGDRAEHDKKKKAVQKWVLCRCHPEMLLLSLPVNCELFSFG